MRINVLKQKNKMSKNKVFIYDTTLRDGTQCEGVSLSVTAKLRLAEKMDKFGFDFIGIESARYGLL